MPHVNRITAAMIRSVVITTSRATRRRHAVRDARTSLLTDRAGEVMRRPYVDINYVVLLSRSSFSRRCSRRPPAWRPTYRSRLRPWHSKLRRSCSIRCAPKRKKCSRPYPRHSTSYLGAATELGRRFATSLALSQQASLALQQSAALSPADLSKATLKVTKPDESNNAVITLAIMETSKNKIYVRATNEDERPETKQSFPRRQVISNATRTAESVEEGPGDNLVNGATADKAERPVSATSTAETVSRIAVCGALTARSEVDEAVTRSN